MLAFGFQSATPIRQLLFLPIIEAALRYGLVASVIWAFATAPVLVGFELIRQSNQANVPFRTGFITLQLGIEVLTA